MTTYRNSSVQPFCDRCWKEFPAEDMVPINDDGKFECKRCHAVPEHERPYFNPLLGNKSYDAEREAWVHGTFKNGVWAKSIVQEKLTRDFANRLGPAPKKKDMEHEGVVAFVERIQRSRWWKSKVKRRVTVDVDFRVKSNSWSWGDWRTGQIKLAAHDYNRWVVLHEIAHVITPENGHGREWRRWYVLLVERFIGKEEADLLRNSMRRRNLKFSARRTLSPEAREAAAERLAAMRRAS